MTSDAQSRDIQAINYTLSFHGRVLIDSATVALNYGQRLASCSPAALSLQLTTATITDMVFWVKTAAAR